MAKRLLICVAILLFVSSGVVVTVYQATQTKNANPNGILGRVDRFFTPEAATNQEAPPRQDSRLSEKLLRALQNPNASVRREAIQQFLASRTTDAAALPALIAALNDGDPLVRVEAAEAIGTYKDSASSAVPALVERLKDPDEAVRHASLKALRPINADLSEYVPVLLERLGDPDPTMQQQFVSQPPMRDNVAWLLAKVEERADRTAESIVPKLIELLESGSEDARDGAARVVGLLGSHALDAVPALLDSAKGLTDQAFFDRAVKISHEWYAEKRLAR